MHGQMDFHFNRAQNAFIMEKWKVDKFCLFFNKALVLPKPKEEKVNINRKEEKWVL
jgi:hypothetical protein